MDLCFSPTKEESVDDHIGDYYEPDLLAAIFACISLVSYMVPANIRAMGSGKYNLAMYLGGKKKKKLGLVSSEHIFASA